MRFVEMNMTTLVVLLMALTLTLLVAAALFLNIAYTLKKRYQLLVCNKDNVNFEELLNLYAQLISDGRSRQEETEQRLEAVERKIISAVSGVAMHRYSAFRETGSDLSFSLALLNRNKDGVVLTSIFGREESRAYGKPIRGGKAAQLLSEEELAALKAAVKSMH